ncbi:hypothetical protein J7T55_008613 [Diaporthe amygdali]|uniref:uncharacterized protein n=1 Tax=Phomopsis amygdali TaxID=1214568 RepID=UPI0022FF4069|nr:uncharacterized protein J7T55_008613 [Diaporthe amygdali]KAJ0121449.1 hypothetical protein J7T55_008613 [Diaporthe amygdali]
MYIKAAVLFLAASALALPTVQDGNHKRAAVLTKQSYADFQVSDGVAGNALAEVQAKFPIDENDLANVDPADAAIIKAARVTAEDAEVNTGGFNDAIAAASGDAADALQVGKIKNKVLKLKLEVLDLGISQAQGGSDNTAKIAAEQKKLDTNIATDKKSAGQTSQSVNFQG